MRMISNIRVVIRAFKGIKNKKEIVYTVRKTLQKGGLRELKKEFLLAAGRGEKAECDDLYAVQQLEVEEYDGNFANVLFIILAEQKDAYIADTCESIGKLKNIEKEVVIVAIEGFIGNSKLPIYNYTDNWAEQVSAVIDKSQADYVYLIRGGNYVAPNMGGAMFESVSHSDFDIIFSDECIEMENSKKCILKSDFSRFDLLYNQNMGQAVAFSRKSILKVGGVDKTINRLDDLICDLFFKLSGSEESIKHIDKVLLIHKYDYKENVDAIRHQIMNRELLKYGVSAKTVLYNNVLRLETGNAANSVSIIIPAETYEDTVECINSILEQTRYVSYDINVVANHDIVKALDKRYNYVKNIRCIVADQYSYSGKCNIGAKEAIGDILFFISDDVRVIQNDWLYNMERLFAFPWVGGVSPKVVRNENTIRYAGIIAGGFGFTPIPFNGEMNEYKVNKNEPIFYSHEVSILSATCLAVRRESFEQINGFNEQEVPDKFSNAVLSFELTRNSYSCIYCAESTVVAGSKLWYDSWYDKEDSGSYLYLLKNYGDFLTYDPYFTDAMKQQYLRGVPKEFRIYKKKIDFEKKNSILMVSHDALLGGATIVLQSAAKILKNNGYFVTFLVPEEGRILEELEAEGIDYIVDNSLYGNDEWIKYACNYDIIFLSTLIMGQKIQKLNACEKKIIWWIHEAPEFYRNMRDKIVLDNCENLSVFCGGGYAQRVFEKNFPGVLSRVLLYGVPDNRADNITLTAKGNKLVFISVGTIEKRKGQDILCEAIRKLSKEEREKCSFIFIGGCIHQDIYMCVEQLVQEYPEQVSWIPPVKREKLMQLYRECTCVICSSREDPMPVFMTECMMQSRIPICSENTGTASVLQDGYDGFLYHNDSADELADKIRYVIEHRDELDSIGNNARKTYEEVFSMEQFEKNIIREIESVLFE